jgi:hypothetical protein
MRLNESGASSRRYCLNFAEQLHSVKSRKIVARCPGAEAGIAGQGFPVREYVIATGLLSSLRTGAFEVAGIRREFSMRLQ